MSKITRLQSENFKKIVAIDIHPGSGVVPIRGRNAQGKSSTLDAIQAALGGKSVMPSRPVRAGEEEGAIRVELDDGTLILRRFSADGRDSIEVTNAEGFRAPSPQKMLDSLYASVAFDPLAFTRLDAAKQFDVLRGLVKLDVDIDALAAANKQDHAERTIVNREVKDRAAQLPAYQVEGIVPAEPVDEAAIEARIAEAGDHNVDIERRRARREQAGVKMAEHGATAERWQEEVSRLRQEVIAAERNEMQAIEAAAILQGQLDAAAPLPEPIDTTAVAGELRDARAANGRYAAAAHYAALTASLEQRRKDADALTEAMAQREKLRAEAIARAEMPVPDLAFGEGEVLLNGLPLDQASSAEQLRVSTAIGMASSPKLRVMLVRDGSLLDDGGQTILAELAEANDFQLWIEAVDTSGKVGIVLEDGAVVSIDGEPAPEPEPIGTPKRRAKKSAADGEAETPVPDERTPPDVEKVPTRGRPEPVGLFD